MVDLYDRDKGNISLPVTLQSYDNNEDQKQKPTIINMQRAFYDIRIADIKNRTDRLENRNNELLEEIETTNELLSTVDAETAEEIASLNKQVSSYSNSIESLKSQIDTLENDRIKDKQSHEEKIVLFNKKYTKEKIELVSQIKILNAKINVLEDFKKLQTPLQERLKENEEQMVKNEENVKAILEKIQLKIEFDKEMCKNEMYECLLNLAAQFQLETNKHISPPNQRLMRENVMLKNELLQISKDVSSKMDTQVYIKNSVIEHKRRIGVRSSYAKQNIAISKIQDIVLKVLRKKFENVKEYLLSVTIPDPEAERRYLMLIENARREENDVNYRLSLVKTLLHKERTKINIVKYVLKKFECKIRALVETIYDLKYTVMCSLKCPCSYKDMAKFCCLEIFLVLRDILIKGQSKLRSHIIKSLETIPQELVPYTEDFKDLSDSINYEILINFPDKFSELEFEEKELEEKEITEKTEHIEDSEKQKELSTESSEFHEDMEEDAASIDLHLEDAYELSTYGESGEESLLDE
ncbi:hypothetical protein ANTRET_LOCUS5509 [Anthophora retusa]